MTATSRAMSPTVTTRCSSAPGLFAPAHPRPGQGVAPSGRATDNGHETMTFRAGAALLAVYGLTLGSYCIYASYRKTDLHWGPLFVRRSGYVILGIGLASTLAALAQ